MRVAVIYRPRNPPPLEAIPMLASGLGQWLEKYGARFSMLEFFVAGGGLGVIDVDDSAELNRIAAENPFTPFSEVEIRPVVDPSVGLATMAEAYAARAKAMG
ncbi:MAG: hypothetical protein ACRDLP_12930 [Solirubrobacteraceae bacterium]